MMVLYYEGSTITLLGNVNESVYLVTTSKFTLDLNGFAITGTDDKGYGFLIGYSEIGDVDGSEVTIKNGTIVGIDNGVTTNGTLSNISLTMENADIEATSYNSVAIYLVAGGSAEIYGGSVTGGTGVQLCGMSRGKQFGCWRWHLVRETRG